MKQNHQDKTVYQQIKCPESLREAFAEAASANDQTASQLIRQFMRDYIKKHGKESK